MPAKNFACNNSYFLNNFHSLILNDIIKPNETNFTKVICNCDTFKH